MNKRWKVIMLAFAMLFCCNMKVNAAQVYTITEEEGNLTCKVEEQVQTNITFALKETDGTYTIVQPGTKDSVIYSFNENGIGTVYSKNGFVKITYKDKAYVYYLKSGKIQKNTIVGNKNEGYYYVDNEGVRSTEKEIKQAVSFVRKHTKSDWSKSKKLETCYNYFWKHYTYERFYDKPSAKKMSKYANYMFSKKRGNCFRYGAAFAYIARVIGCDSRVATGKISSTHGGMTPHGWAEIKKDGKWYICDANMQRNFPTVNSYLRTEKTYAYRHECSKRYKMTVKNGKVSWK